MDGPHAASILGSVEDTLTHGRTCRLRAEQEIAPERQTGWLHLSKMWETLAQHHMSADERAVEFTKLAEFEAGIMQAPAIAAPANHQGSRHYS